MKFGTFTAKTNPSGDKFTAREHLNTPLLMQIIGFSPSIETDFGISDVVNANIIEPTTDTVFVNASLWNKAVVDQLKGYLDSGETLPVMIVEHATKNKQNTFFTVVGVPEASDEMRLCQAWVDSNPNRLEDEINARKRAAGEQNTAIQAQKTGISPMATPAKVETQVIPTEDAVARALQVLEASKASR